MDYNSWFLTDVAIYVMTAVVGIAVISAAAIDIERVARFNEYRARLLDTPGSSRGLQNDPCIIDDIRPIEFKSIATGDLDRPQ